MGGIGIEFNILGITDIITLTLVCTLIAIVIIGAWYHVRKYFKARETVADEAPEEIFRMVSRVKYSPSTDSPIQHTMSAPRHMDQGTEPKPFDVELTRDRQDLTASLKALAEKYSLAEIILATDDGLVFATSADRDVQLDAVKYSQIAKHQAPPDEPDVTLFELMHRESRLFGIIRTARDLPQSWKRQIRDDTKVILQWWL